MGRKVILILDGASDNPVPSLGGRTPLEAARTPHLDALARKGRVGLAETVPPEFTAASDVANLKLLGHDPRGLYTGRGPLEAAAMGVTLEPGDIAFRVNTISVEESPKGDLMLDYSAGHISTEESHAVIESCRGIVESLGGVIHPGVQYRHLMVRRDEADAKTFPPHDNIGRPIAEMKPAGPLGRLFDESRRLLRDHPVNVKRRAAGKRCADALWAWGQGRAVSLPSIGDRFGAKGSLISAVDLIRGIGVLTGFRVIEVSGMTGYFDTNYAGKGEAAVEALRNGDDVVVVHVEAPDEAGHSKSPEEKVKAIENIDREVVARLIDGIPDLAILAAPDHPTYVATGLHGSEPVPYLLCDLKNPVPGPSSYSERTAVGDAVDAARLFTDFMRLAG